MPSARHIQIDEPLSVQAEEGRTDLHPLLRDIHATNTSNLSTLHSRGEVVFHEGEPARGVYILRTGRATVSISSSEGRLVILRVAQSGDVLGLNSTLRNSPYETTVKTLEPCRTDFISNVQLLRLMERSQAGTQAILKILGRELAELTERAKSLLLPQTASGRLAKLLLELGRENVREPAAPRIDKVFTQEEIAQMICSSRETVTRLLAVLSRRHIIEITSDSILICDRAALETMAGELSKSQNNVTVVTSNDSSKP